MRLKVCIKYNEKDNNSRSICCVKMEHLFGMLASYSVCACFSFYVKLLLSEYSDYARYSTAWAQLWCIWMLIQSILVIDWFCFDWINIVDIGSMLVTVCICNVLFTAWEFERSSLQGTACAYAWNRCKRLEWRDIGEIEREKGGGDGNHKRLFYSFELNKWRRTAAFCHIPFIPLI